MTAMMPVNGQQPTMSSREISDIVESRHDSVKRAMERLRDKGLISFTPMVETLEQGLTAKAVTNYHVNQRDSYVVVAQLSPVFTARLVDRWQELEQKQQSLQADDSDLLARAVLVAQKQLDDKSRLIAQQRQQIEQAQPKVEFHDAVTQGSQEYTVQEAAKMLGTGQNRLFRFLKDNAYLDCDKHPYQRWLNQKLFTVRLKPNYKPTGPATYPRTFITAKGLGRLARELLLDQIHHQPKASPQQQEFYHG